MSFPSKLKLVSCPFDSLPPLSVSAQREPLGDNWRRFYRSHAVPVTKKIVFNKKLLLKLFHQP